MSIFKKSSLSLAPIECVYRPTPPQGITMTPTEIGTWKSMIVQCEQSMLSITLDACCREVTLRHHDMTEARKALASCLETNIEIANQSETQLCLKLASTRSRTLTTYAELYASAKARKTAFNNNTNLFKLKESSTTSNDRRSRNRSHSRRSNSKKRSRSSSLQIADLINTENLLPLQTVQTIDHPHQMTAPATTMKLHNRPWTSLPRCSDP